MHLSGVFGKSEEVVHSIDKSRINFFGIAMN